MTLVSALSALYAASGMAACACYGPQILRMVRQAEARRAMSLAAWGGWLAVSLVGLVYATVVVGRREMMVVCAFNVLGQAVIVWLAAAQRWRDWRHMKMAGAGPAIAKGI
ncbi:MAG: hypothetical protein NVV74_15985 [Magnetospirillum sp.]|nr:hypothetical protein [Magnetospirillum sp.]